MSGYSTAEGLKKLNELGLKSVVETLRDNVYMEDSSDKEEAFEYWELQKALGHLEKTVRVLEYLKRPVIEEGELIKQENDRYRIGENGTELTSGEEVEVLYEGAEWIRTTVEWGILDDYYFTELPDVLLERSIVRRR